MSFLSFGSGWLGDYLTINPIITFLVYCALSYILGFLLSRFFVFSKMTKVISLIVPVFNEEETINIFYRTVRKELILPDCVVEIVFINDGSRDKTESIINGLAQDD